MIRVKRKSDGTEFTVADSTPIGDDVEVIDKPAVDADNDTALPPKYKTEVRAASQTATTTATKSAGKES